MPPCDADEVLQAAAQPWLGAIGPHPLSRLGTRVIEFLERGHVDRSALTDLLDRVDNGEVASVGVLVGTMVSAQQTTGPP